MLPVLTIGHSNRTWKEFLELLRAHRVKRVIDVRSIPRSRHNPQFNRVIRLASVFISRWDKATMEKVPGELRDKLGIAVAERTYKAYRQLLDSERWLRLANAGARPQRLLWASTGTKDATASDVLYIKALAAPFTINTIPDKTLLAFADHGSVGELMAADGGDAEEMIAKFSKAGIDYDKLGTDLQREAAESFVKDWNEMLASIASKSAEFKAAA
jgi:transaldolase